MAGNKIDMAKRPPAVFNDLKETWLRRAMSSNLPRPAIRIAAVLPGYVNREFGYAFPSDMELADAITTSARNIGKGMRALEDADLIFRQTRVKRDDNREAIGRERRIFLTLPKPKPLSLVEGERNTSSEVNGTEVNGMPEVNGTKWAGERNDGVPNIPDSTADFKTRHEDRKVGVYARESERNEPDPSVPVPSPDERVDASVSASSPLLIGEIPPPFEDDIDFVRAFDRFMIELTEKKEIGAGELETITATAFNRATESDDLFMPMDWEGACKSGGATRAVEWFRQRAGQHVHRRKAA